MRFTTRNVVIVFCLLFILFSGFVYCLYNDTERELYTESFAIRFYETAQRSNIIPLKDLVPTSWDRVHIFQAYTTPAEKYAYAGYRYSNDLFETPENAISLVFFDDDHVSYYVDFICPHSFDFLHSSFGDWGYYALITDATYDNQPGFQLRKSESGYNIFVLDILL